MHQLWCWAFPGLSPSQVTLKKSGPLRLESKLGSIQKLLAERESRGFLKNRKDESHKFPLWTPHGKKGWEPWLSYSPWYVIDCVQETKRRMCKEDKRWILQYSGFKIIIKSLGYYVQTSIFSKSEILGLSRSPPSGLLLHTGNENLLTRDLITWLPDKLRSPGTQESGAWSSAPCPVVLFWWFKFSYCLWPW